MRPAKTIQEGLDMLEKWHYKLRVAEETLKSNPEPQRAWMAIQGLLGTLIAHHPEFALEWTDVKRSAGMREGATNDKIELVIPQLEVELAQRAQD